MRVGEGWGLAANLAVVVSHCYPARSTMPLSPRNLLAANWKMHLTTSEAEALLRATAAGLSRLEECPPVVLAVPFPYLLQASSVAAAHNNLFVAAQTLSEHEKGPFTGEVSGAMIRSCGATHVIVGHSERRQLFLEDDNHLLKKLQRALAEGLRPIFCLGETLAERQAGQWQQVLAQQLNRTVLQLPEDARQHISLAYEPVWAIGTGQTATPTQAAEAHDFMRSLLGAHGPTCTILYGGSVNPANAAELFAQPTIDGGLVGGASLKADDFVAIARALAG